MENTALQTAAQIAHMAQQAKLAFIDRDAAIQAIALGLVSGEHVILLGPPGTGKTKLAKWFAKATGQSFFKIELNPDTTREDLIGPIDPVALRDGRWDRAWAGLALCSVALVDEVGKASSQVANILLGIMEERTVTSGNLDKPIPLHSLIGASNETIDRTSPAIWDRFALRVVVEYLTKPAHFDALLTSAWGDPPSSPLSDGDFEITRKACYDMAARASRPVLDKMLQLWSGIANCLTDPVSDRRWMKGLVIAAAAALLAGRTEIGIQDLIVLKDMLWTKIAERQALEGWLTDMVWSDRRELHEISVLLDGLVDELAGKRTLEQVGKVVYRIKRAQQRLESLNTGADDEALGALSVRMASMLQTCYDRA